MGQSLALLTGAANRALESGLWDVAAKKLEEASRIKNLTPAEQSSVFLLLAESLVRGNKPDRAMTILDREGLKNDPNTSFWMGQAMVGKGRYAEAVEILRKVAEDPNHPFQSEAALTASSLQLSLAKPDDALALLALLNSSKNPDIAAKSKLKQTEILIDHGRYNEAEAILPASADIPASLIPLDNFVKAYLLLSQGHPQEAETIFTSLLENPIGQGILRYNQAALGKADALAAQGKTDDSTLFLLTYIQTNQFSPLLESMFDRIIAWLPEKIISTDFPTLVRIAAWLPQTAPLGTGLINTGFVSAISAYPLPSQAITDLSIFSLYARAIGLHRIDTIAAKSEAKSLLQRIRILAPQHFLSPRSLLTLAKWKQEEGKPDDAFAILEILRATAKSPLIRGEAAFLNAAILFEKGDTTLSAEFYEEASHLLKNGNSAAASLNSALARLKQNPSAPIVIENEDPAVAEKLNTDLALEKALLSETPTEAKTALDAFLKAHPNHPRAAEARLNIIEAALGLAPPDLSLAKAQIDTLSASPTALPPELAPRFALARLHYFDHSGDTEQAVGTAKEITDAFPDSTAASDAALIMGKKLFQTGNYNEARLVFEKLAARDPSTQRSQAALLLAARSAALGATAQSREEALALFDKAIVIPGPLSALARLEKARLNIDLNHLPEAIESLKNAYKITQPDDLSRLPTGLLLAEATYAQGDTNPDSLKDALEIYDGLIGLTATNPAQYFRLQYLRGLTLEKLPDPDDPTKTRVGDALSAYFSVLDRPTDPPPPEWEWFERSGFRALSLLENAHRWQAAIAIAEKIASFKGPRAEEASTRARQLRLKHMIWED